LTELINLHTFQQTPISFQNLDEFNNKESLINQLFMSLVHQPGNQLLIEHFFDLLIDISYDLYNLDIIIIFHIHHHTLFHVFHKLVYLLAYLLAYRIQQLIFQPVDIFKLGKFGSPFHHRVYQYLQKLIVIIVTLLFVLDVLFYDRDTVFADVLDQFFVLIVL